MSADRGDVELSIFAKVSLKSGPVFGQNNSGWVIADRYGIWISVFT
jgi:hypothetical protein